MVQNAGLAGLEACKLNSTEVTKLEKERNRLARKTMGRQGWGAVERDDKEAVSVTNKQVMERMGLWTMASTLRLRRLRWLHSMAKAEGDHEMFFAALLGKFGWEKVEEIDKETFLPRKGANPLLVQMQA